MVPDDLLDTVRRVVLIRRAVSDYNPLHISLGTAARESGANRGHVQKCLSILAKEGIMFERTKPEGGVARYEHGETDKVFRYRFTMEEAVAKLKELGISYENPIKSAVENRNQYAHPTLFKK
jgi:DNA-binding transcriptional regulator YhcF (GntR family)